LQDAVNEGMACYQSALKIFKRKNLIFGQGSALNGIGDIYSRLVQWDKAMTSQQNAIQLLKHNNSDQSHRIQGMLTLALERHISGRIG
jgi:tetratricopeptide (TPR) repeat protein